MMSRSPVIVFIYLSSRLGSVWVYVKVDGPVYGQDWDKVEHDAFVFRLIHPIRVRVRVRVRMMPL